MVLYPLWEGAGGNTKNQMEETLDLGLIKSGQAIYKEPNRIF